MGLGHIEALSHDVGDGGVIATGATCNESEKGNARQRTKTFHNRLLPLARARRVPRDLGTSGHLG